MRWDSPPLLILACPRLVSLSLRRSWPAAMSGRRSSARASKDSVEAANDIIDREVISSLELPHDQVDWPEVETKARAAYVT